MSDGQPCDKCYDIEKLLQDAGYINRIDRIVAACKHDQGSEGMMLADLFQVHHTPFFIVETKEHGAHVYTCISQIC